MLQAITHLVEKFKTNIPDVIQSILYQNKNSM